MQVRRHVFILQPSPASYHPYFSTPCLFHTSPLLLLVWHTLRSVVSLLSLPLPHLLPGYALHNDQTLSFLSVPGRNGCSMPSLLFQLPMAGLTAGKGRGGGRPEQEDKCPEKVRSENRREVEQDGSLVSLQFNDTFYP